MIPKQLNLPNHLSPLMPVYFNIRNSLQGLSNKKLTKALKTEIFEMINSHGQQAEKFMIGYLMQNLDSKEIKEKGLNSSKANFLAQALNELSTREEFMYYFADVLVSSVKNPMEYVFAAVKHLKLQTVAQIAIGLSLYLSESEGLAKDGYHYLKNKVIEYCQAERQVEFPSKVLQELLFQIGTNPQFSSELEEHYQHLLDTNIPDSAKPGEFSELKFYHYMNNNYKVFSYEPPLVSKPAEIIKKVDVMRNLGPYCTFNVESLKTVLQECGPLTEQDVFECMMLMAEESIIVEDSIDRFMTDLMVAHKKISKAQEWKKFYQPVNLNEKKMQAAWNVDVFLTYAVQNVPNLKWTSVLGYFDRLNLQFKNPKAFVNMFKFFQKAKKQGPKYKTPEVLFFKKWNHPRSQLNFLIHMFKCDQPDILCLNEINNKKMSRSADSLKSANLLQYQLWSYPDLVQLLIELSDFNYFETRELFDVPLMNCPQLLLYTICDINFSKGEALLNEIYSQLFPVFIGNHMNHIKLLENVWETNEDLLISSICEVYKNESKKQTSTLNLSKVLDITQNIRDGLIPLTSWNDYSFSVALGILAGKREFLHFEQWIKERLKNVGGPFLIAILQYIEDNFLRQIREFVLKFGANNQSLHQTIDIQLEKAQLSRQLLAFVYESSLQFPSSKFDLKAVEMLKRQYKQICQHFPEMTDSQVIDEIELLAERNFFKIYKQEISIKEAIDMMHNLRNSPRQQEKELYASMITYLFTELRFHSNYPEKELIITANFFAAIINAKFIERKLFTVFLQVLTDDLKYTDRRYTFAITVINQIKDRLVEEPVFVEGLVDNEQIMSKHPEVVKDLLDKFQPPLEIPPDKLLQIKNSIDVKFAPPPPTIPADPEKQVVSPVREVDVPESEMDLLEIEERIEKLAKNNPNIGKLNLFCNTLTKESMKERLGDLGKWLDSKEIVKWFSYHLVYKRITSCQPAMFPVYYDLISQMPIITKPVLNVTYKVLQRWFAIEGKSVNDKKLKCFKNIGAWLGKITIARSQPILMSRIDLREILISSYLKKNRLLLNIEVISKILESRSSEQFLFSIRNPWLAPILGALKEISSKVTDGNIKNEIQKLFKNILVNESEIPDSLYLSYNFDKSHLTIAELPEYVHICDEQLKVFIDKGVDLRKIISEAVDAAIQEIVPPVISRSVTIALVTTKQLALKDFVLEPDENKVLRGVHSIAQNLSGSLALVTCREPLKMSLSTFLKKKLEEYAFLSEADCEQIISTAARENLDLGCALIKRAVIEKALQQIEKDQIIQDQLEKRREARAHGEIFQNDSSFYDIPDFIPEILKPRFGGMTEEDCKIYDDFEIEKKPNSLNYDKKEEDPEPTREKLEKIMAMIEDGDSPEHIREFMIKNQFRGYAELAEKLLLLLFQHKDPFTKYFLELFKLIKLFTKPEHNYTFFLENMTRARGEYYQMIIELCSIGFFPPRAEKEAVDPTKIFAYEDDDFERKSITLFQSWVKSSNDSVITSQLASLVDKFLDGDKQEEIRKFYYFVIKHAISACIKSERTYLDVLDFKDIDHVSRLILMNLKIATTNRGIYFEHILDSYRTVMKVEHSADDREFNQRPFFRLLLNIIQQISDQPQKYEDGVAVSVFTTLAVFFQRVEPKIFPGFAFAWLELISNKFFMPKILDNYDQWDLYHQLLLEALRFLRNNFGMDALSENEMQRVFYKGVLRLVTILLHDYPDFSSEFSFTLSNQIPGRFVQLRNVILSAFPQSQWFPEPQTVHFKDLEAIKYMKESPKYYCDKESRDFQVLGLFKGKSRMMKLKDLMEKESSRRINYFILKAGAYASTEGNTHRKTNAFQEDEDRNEGQESLEEQNQTKGQEGKVQKKKEEEKKMHKKNAKDQDKKASAESPKASQIKSGRKEQQAGQAKNNQPTLEQDSLQVTQMLLWLLNNLQSETARLFIQGILNQIRFPNLTTLFFIKLINTILYEQSNKALQKNLIKAIFERMLVEKPHPWGIIFVVNDIKRSKKKLAHLEMTEIDGL